MVPHKETKDLIEEVGYGKPIVAKFNYDTLLFTNVTIMSI